MRTLGSPTADIPLANQFHNARTAVVLSKRLEISRVLGHSVQPRVATIIQRNLSGLCPFVVQTLSTVFACLFECSAEDEIGSRVLLSPPFKVAVSISAWTGEVLIDLTVAIDHQATSGLR